MDDIDLSVYPLPEEDEGKEDSGLVQFFSDLDDPNVSLRSYLDSSSSTKKMYTNEDSESRRGDKRAPPMQSKSTVLPELALIQMVKDVHAILSTIKEAKECITKCNMEAVPLVSLEEILHSNMIEMKQLIESMLHGRGLLRKSAVSELAKVILQSVQLIIGSFIDQFRLLQEEVKLIREAKHNLTYHQSQLIKEQKELQNAIEFTRKRFKEEEKVFCSTYTGS